MSSLEMILKDVKALSDSLQQKFYLLGIEIEDNFLKIKSSQTIKDTEQYFNSLQKIQDLLSELVFKEYIKVPDFLWIFIKDFDRLDDQDLRQYMYNEIKENRYFFKRR